MATISLHQLLSMPQVTRVISTRKTPQSRIQDWLGMGPDGSNQNSVGGHVAAWDIFDKTRSMAQGRAPGVGPATIAPQVIGHQTMTMYRSHEKMFLLEERIFRTRPLGQNFGSVESRGQAYVTKQEGHMAQRFRNNREFMVSRMLRGIFYLVQDGDNWNPTDSSSGAAITVDYLIPAGNKTKLDMLGAGDIVATSWDNASASILGDVLAINAANEQLHGQSVAHLWTDTTILQYMMANTELKALGGTANTMWVDGTYGRTGFKGPDGMRDTGIEIVFKGIPFLKVHAYDAGLAVMGGAGTSTTYGGEPGPTNTFTKFYGGTTGSFTPEPDSSWCEMMIGSEIVAENVMSPGVEKYGLAAWTERCTQPAGFELIGVDNCLPALYIPKCVQYGLLKY